MKQLLVSLIIIMISGTSCQAQMLDPVKWSFAATKKSEKSYEIRITANVQKPWHIYSQNTADAGPTPTKFTFKPNPLVTLNGNPKENGKLLSYFDKNFGVEVKYFGEKVEFVQIVTLKAAVKTNITGTVEYLVCNDATCLPPKKVSFDIKLQ